MKALLLLVLAGLSGGLLVCLSPSLSVLALLLTCVWASCRAYYFAFYVIEHYIDDGHRFEGLASFVRYAMRRRFR